MFQYFQLLFPLKNGSGDSSQVSRYVKVTVQLTGYLNSLCNCWSYLRCFKFVTKMYNFHINMTHPILRQRYRHVNRSLTCLTHVETADVSQYDDAFCSNIMNASYCEIWKRKKTGTFSVGFFQVRSSLRTKGKTQKYKRKY